MPVQLAGGDDTGNVKNDVSVTHIEVNNGSVDTANTNATLDQDPLDDNATPSEIAIESQRWKHRRRMAYVALYSIIVVMALCLFYLDKDRINVLQNVLNWFFTVMGTIVTAYFGFATWANLSGNNNPPSSGPKTR